MDSACESIPPVDHNQSASPEPHWPLVLRSHPVWCTVILIVYFWLIPVMVSHLFMTQKWTFVNAVDALANGWAWLSALAFWLAVVPFSLITLITMRKPVFHDVEHDEMD